MATDRVPTSDARTFELIAALASASETAHNEGTLAQKLADVLSERLPLIELVLEGPSERRRWQGTAAGTAAETRAMDLGDGRRLVLALASPVPWTKHAHAAIASVIRAGFTHVRTLGRVAALSHRAHRDREALREQIAEGLPIVVAESPAMRRLLDETLPLVAREDVTVLVRGETGTGKELIARRVHALSRRARRPFLAIDCGALPESLAESALFGHERGAFTGAIARHVGVIERAHEGTLFLDEVGELSLSMQTRLLRVLETGELTRVGGAKTVRVDVRLVAATHRPLETMVAAKSFRQDLFYRLHVVPLELPPLRERREDIEPLARLAIESCASRSARPSLDLDPRDVARLVAWPWPGNVRELHNLVERAFVLSRGPTLELPEGWDTERGPSVSSNAPERFDDAQRRVILAALAACGGRIYGTDGAAARLGLPPTTLQSKLEKLGLRRST